jgi:hypothetical protein
MAFCSFDPTVINKIDLKSKIRFGLKLAEKSFILFLLVHLENFLCYENNSQFAVRWTLKYFPRILERENSEYAQNKFFTLNNA